VTSHPGELSLAIPSWVGAMSTSQLLLLLLLLQNLYSAQIQASSSQRRWAVMPCGWGVKAGMGWQVKLCDPLVTHGPHLSALEMSL